MNYSVFRNRPELRFTMETVLLFPFYRTWCLLFRLYALLRNVIMYSAWVRKLIRISTREQDMHDIPPVGVCFVEPFLCVCLWCVCVGGGAELDTPSRRHLPSALCRAR
jgi:hypothetical protein